MEERSLFGDDNERGRDTGEGGESSRKGSREGKRPATYYEVSEGEEGETEDDESERELVKKKERRYDA